RPDGESHTDVFTRGDDDLPGLRHVTAVLLPAGTDLVGVVAAGLEGRGAEVTDGARRGRLRPVELEFGGRGQRDGYVGRVVGLRGDGRKRGGSLPAVGRPGAGGASLIGRLNLPV